MSLMETYLVATCPVKGCNLHIETPLPESEINEHSEVARSESPERDLQKVTLDIVAKQLDFWHSKTDHE